MAWRHLVLTAAVAAGLAGCGTSHVALAGSKTGEALPAPLPAVSRMQKAELS